MIALLPEDPKPRLEKTPSFLLKMDSGIYKETISNLFTYTKKNKITSLAKIVIK